MVQVWPKNDLMRKLMKHPTAGGFSSDKSLDPASWPDDSFTLRRVRNGDVVTVPPASEPAAWVEEPKPEPAPPVKRATRKTVDED